ncbi:unnamed protein product [Gongylonema pulchrum]|uniref:Secreted protein n=1 Tax=Gongylonema pulchrum TaxID=637853 RepID=A0A183D1I1_9BILA|nr:unnamed protein product [Gongylonema pulchrum]
MRFLAGYQSDSAVLVITAVDRSDIDDTACDDGIAISCVNLDEEVKKLCLCYDAESSSQHIRLRRLFQVAFSSLCKLVDLADFGSCKKVSYYLNRILIDSQISFFRKFAGFFHVRNSRRYVRTSAVIVRLY